MQGNAPEQAPRSAGLDRRRQTWSVAELGSTLASRWHDAAFVVIGAAILAWVAYDAAVTRLITYSPSSDYWEHTAALHALMEDPVDPRHPHLGDDTDSPRFGPHFLWIALSSRVLGLDPIEAMGLAAVANTLLFLAGIQTFFRSYFRDPKAPLFGLVVLFGAWVNAPHFSNVYELKTFFSVAGYPSTAALGVTLLTFALMLSVLRQAREPRAKLALLALAFAYVYVTHQLTAMMSLTGGFLLAATEPGVERRRRLVVLATLPVGLLLAAAWPYYRSFSLVSGGTVKYVKAGGKVREKFYELETLIGVVGFAAPGLLALGYFAIRRVHLFLVLGALAVLTPFVVNYVRPVPLGHRFVLLAAFYVQAAFVWLLLRLWDGLPGSRWLDAVPRRIAGRALAAAALLLCLVTSALNAAQRFETHSRRRAGKESSIVHFARVVAARVPPNAVVMATMRDAWPLSTFGTHVVALLHRNPLLRDGTERKLASKRFFSSRAGDAEREAILRRYGATHVIAKGARGALGRFLDQRATPSRLPRGYVLHALERR
jgi:hypothetical protein